MTVRGRKHRHIDPVLLRAAQQLAEHVLMLGAQAGLQVAQHRRREARARLGQPLERHGLRRLGYGKAAALGHGHTFGVQTSNQRFAAVRLHHLTDRSVHQSGDAGQRGQEGPFAPQRGHDVGGQHFVEARRLAQRDEPLSGIAISGVLEGMRPLLLEVQALVSSAVYGMPQRSATGFDLRRLNMLLAVLEKRGGFHFGVKDVFVNIAGGLKIEDPSLDLAIILSLLSSYEDIPLPQGICFAGEVGLNGEIRAVNRIQQRIAEAEKLGFEKIYISEFNYKAIDQKKHHIQIIAVERVDEAYRLFF